MYHHRPQYARVGDPPAEEFRTLLDFDAAWRYNQAGADLGPDWAATPHPPGGDWQSGPGALGFETNPDRLPLSLGTTLTSPFDNSPFVVTYYFETEFQLSADELAVTNGLRVTHAIDDGAVFY
ncbi:MAG: hypothetical protein GWO24_13530, partial [Akkermansiaceae bacterium]|nr:hypothetical protein [Akkermansiaceae bacterium]